jgi:REP element-mobilizing transposase RayT
VALSVRLCQAMAQALNGIIMTPSRRIVIAAHHILTLYGHWAVNDLRGSGSREIIDPKFESLGEIYHGRKPNHLQPKRDELRSFHKQHHELLNFPVFWIDEEKRQEVACAIASVIQQHRYTCYACAICSNHMHLVIRTHKHKALEQWNNFAEAIRQRLRHRFSDTLSANHPVISARPYSVLLFTPSEVHGRVEYIQDNPQKEGLPAQDWEFVAEYDNWPMHNRLFNDGPASGIPAPFDFIHISG